MTASIAGANAFSTEWFNSQPPKPVEKKKVRKTPTVGEYTDKDRTWTFPDNHSVRHHNDEQASYMGSEDRTWRMKPKENLIRHDNANPDSGEYTSRDRTWTFPDPKLTRHDEHLFDQAPALSDEDRMWRKDDPRNKLLHP